MTACFVCDKHRDPGLAVVGADELMVLSHIAPDGGPAYLGHLLLEPRRHAPGLADLTDEEAAALGVWAARGSRALRAAGAEHVYSAVIGHQVDHLHLHLIPRYPGTPREYWWLRLDEWPEANRGDAEAVARFVAQLRT
jgi:diadenosine tetraphosphate (Ap4A) HIT family hydrolase